MSESALPPGQVKTAHFPVVGETAAAPDWHSGSFRLEVDGLVATPKTWDYAQLLALPQQERTIDIHCVTGWSRPATRITGVPLAVLLQASPPLPGAAYVRFVAHSARDHDTSLPLTVALDDTWLVHRIDGVALDAAHGGPLRSFTPSRYFYKSLKWLRRIELRSDDCAGYWERESAYHNDADPWREQRFDEARVATAEQQAALRAAADFAPWRTQVVLKARLGNWQPLSADLSRLQLKYCSLRNARWAGVCLDGANLSLSNLEGADLRDSRARGADFEGASFAGADLRNAHWQDVALSATRFYRDFASGKRLAADVRGLVIDGASGLLDEQAAFLRAHGAELRERR